jgi:GH25 family lysozyme M1 (1,4-beta-N-acetylmuramidase)
MSNLFQYLADDAAVDHNVREPLVSRAAGIVGAIYRADYGRYKDDTFALAAQKAIDAGLVLGGYSFGLHGAEAGDLAMEAQVAAYAAETDRWYALGNPGARPILPPMVDFELPHGWRATGVAHPDELVASLDHEVALFEDEYGVPPIVYLSGRVWNTVDADALGGPAATPRLKRCALALAHYDYAARAPWQRSPGSTPAIPKPWNWAGTRSNYWIHQYQGDAIGVPGYSNTVDMSVFHPLVPGDRSERVVDWLRPRAAAHDGPAPTGDPLVYDAALMRWVQEVQTDHKLDADAVIGLYTFEAMSWMSHRT